MLKSMFVSTLLFLAVSAFGQVSIMTYNIRYANENDRENSWENRKKELVDLILKYNPGILGIQEGLKTQVDFVEKACPHYQFTGVGRDDGKEEGEFTAIFYDTTQFKLLETFTRWLSNTPEEPSTGWDASYKRTLTYVVLHNLRTEQKLIVINTHFDNDGNRARNKSAHMIIDLIEEKRLGESQVVFMGDLNCESNEKPINILKSEFVDSYEVSRTAPIGPEGTFNGFNTELPPTSRIDYIFTKNLNVESYQAIDARRSNDLWLSDHLPVLVQIK